MWNKQKLISTLLTVDFDFAQSTTPDWVTERSRSHIETKCFTWNIRQEPNKKQTMFHMEHNQNKL